MAQSKRPGSFCWVELATSDTTSAKRFYSSLLGWDYREMAIPDRTYTIGQRQGKDICGIYPIEPECPVDGVGAYFMPYIAVLNADEISSKAKTLGATVAAGPFDIMDIGRMATLQDPTGAFFSIWQANQHIGSTANPDAPGAACWYELTTTDEDRASRFYSDLFGWTSKINESNPMKYTEFLNSGTPLGGMIEILPEWGKMASHWLTYFTVEDSDKAAAKSVELGGSIRIPPKDILNVGRFAILGDPQGGCFAVIRLGSMYS